MSSVEIASQAGEPERDCPTVSPPGDRSFAGGSADTETCEQLAERALECGIRRIEIVAWRDVDDPEAGGSELHSHKIASRWAGAGLDVTLRTSAIPGQPASVDRSGYHAVRRNGRYGVFPVVAWEGMRSNDRPDALVEVWNGMPFFSPLWFRGPRIVFLHHVHAEMWGMVLPRALAAIGRNIESVVAPLLYRRSRIVTLSESSRDEIVSMIRIPRRRVSVVTPGVDQIFVPGDERAVNPLVVAVGRLVPVKRFDLLIEALAVARRARPDLEAVIIGEGYERDRLERLRADLHAEEWLSLPGRVSEDELRGWYRRAWVVASTSLREGWGMTLTEAGACGTPGVATRIAGHLDAVIDDSTGLLADGVEGIAAAVTRIVSDDLLRNRLGRAAQEHASTFTWDATATSTLRALLDEAAARPQ